MAESFQPATGRWPLTTAMFRPRVEAVKVIVRGDGRVQMMHGRFGEIFEQIVPAELAKCYGIGAPLERSLRRPTLGERSAGSVAGSGSAATVPAQSEQYLAREPLGRIASRPQCSQYFVSKTSAWALTAAAVLFVLSGMLRAC
jgi:hypothetical protein